MEGGTATRDRFAAAVAGTDAIEIMAATPDRQVAEALKRFRMTTGNDEERFICFFDTPGLEGLIERVAARKQPITKLYGAEREEFLVEMAGHAIDFARLAVLGPLAAWRWEFEDPARPWPITAGLWRRGDGKRLMELSIKAPVAQAAVAVGGFMALLAEVGVERDRSPQTKTRWALGYCVGKLARPRDRATASKKRG